MKCVLEKLRVSFGLSFFLIKYQKKSVIIAKLLKQKTGIKNEFLSKVECYSN